MLTKTWAIAEAVLADAVRRKVVWVVLLFAVVLGFAIPSLPSYGVGVADAVYREVSIGLMYVAALIVSLAISATRIPSELERRTLFSVLARDVRRSQYVVGTWLGGLLVVGIVTFAFTVVAVGTGWWVYSRPMWQLFEGTLAVWFEMGVIMAFTVLMSTRFGSVTSIVGALAFVFIGHSIASLVVPPVEGAEAPWYVPSLDVFNVINPVAHGHGYGLVYAASMTVAFLAWAVVLLGGASLLFRSRDL